MGAPQADLGPLSRSTTHPLSYVASSSLMSCSRLMLGNFSCKSFFMPRLAPTGTTLMLLQWWEQRESEGSWSPRSALCPLLYMHQGVYFESEQSHNLSSTILIRCMGCPTLSPSHQHSLVAEVQLLGVGIVVNEEAALNGVQVHLGRGKEAHELLVDQVLKPGTKTGKECWLSPAVCICRRHCPATPSPRCEGLQPGSSD